MTGKEKCAILKEIRLEFAKMNGIDYHPKECTHRGLCIGTCHQCDMEVTWLNGVLKKKQDKESLIAMWNEILKNHESILSEDIDIDAEEELGLTEPERFYQLPGVVIE